MQWEGAEWITWLRGACIGVLWLQHLILGTIKCGEFLN